MQKLLTCTTTSLILITICTAIISGDNAPVYKAKAALLVQNPESQSLATRKYLITSRTVLRKVVSDLKLAEREQKQEVEKWVNKLKDRIKVIEVSDTQIIQIIATSNEPEEAINLANTVARVYLSQEIEMKQRARITAMDALENQLEHSQEQLNQASHRLEALKKEHGIIDFQHQKMAWLQKLANLESAYETAQSDQRQAEIQYELTQRTLENTAEEIKLTTSKNLNPNLQELQRKLIDKQIELETAKAKLTEGNIQIHLLRNEIQQLQKHLESEVSMLLSSEQIGPNPIYQRLQETLTNLAIQKDVLLMKAEYLQQQLQVNRKELEEFLENESVLLRLEEDASILQEIHRNLRMKYEQAKAEMWLAEAQVDVILIELAENTL